MKRRLWIVLLLAITGAWGASFSVIHDAVLHLDPIAFVAIRFWVATVVMLVFGGPRMFRALTRATWKDGFWLALCLSAGYLLQTLGIARTSPSHAAFLTGISVVLVPALLAFGSFRMPLPGWLAVGLAVLGLGVLTLEPGALSVGAGDLFCVGCAVAYAVQIVLTGRYADQHPLMALTFVELALAACFNTVAWWLFGEPVPMAVLGSASIWAAVLFAAIVCTVLAYLVMNAAQRVVSPWEAGLVFATEPLFATAVAIAAGIEFFTWRTAIGGSVILSAMVLAELAQREPSSESSALSSVTIANP